LLPRLRTSTRPTSSRRFGGRASRAATGCVLLVSCVACAPQGAAQQAAPGIVLEPVVSGLDRPVYVTAPEGDPRLFIVEQSGLVRLLVGGKLLAQPFLDLRDRVRSGGEQGLLSLAFHPRYAVNGRFFVNYTDRRGDTQVVRFRVSDDPNRAALDSATPILHVPQPYSNHNGGHILFGPDGMLYVGMGDGGAGGDPQGNGQNRSGLLGDLLRIDVDRGDPYAIPPDNPFVGRRDVRGEIWAWGLRNPWRICFDPVDGLIYIADVGQNRWEEIDVAPADRGGINYGWNLWEGRHRYGRSGDASVEVMHPVLEYGRGDGCSVTGGYVYRGKAVPELIGHYVYADYCEGWIRSFRYRDGRATQPREWAVGDIGRVLSFGLDGAQELYVCSNDGIVYRFARPASRP
jgi:glucose/arabinose dehydrogenase